jgi:DNA-binding MarR family transcriptional regulator
VAQVYEAIGDQLVAYDAAADEGEARTMCQKLIDKLSAQGLCEKKIDPEAVKREEENKLVMYPKSPHYSIVFFWHYW